MVQLKNLHLINVKIFMSQYTIWMELLIAVWNLLIQDKVISILNGKLLLILDLYVVLLQYKDSKATQIVHVEEKFTSTYDKDDLDMADLAREFNELESFAERFSGENFDTNPRFASVINEIKSGLANRDAENVDDNLEELKIIIERYLPVRSRSAVLKLTMRMMI